MSNPKLPQDYPILAAALGGGGITCMHAWTESGWQQAAGGRPGGTWE